MDKEQGQTTQTGTPAAEPQNPAAEPQNLPSDGIALTDEGGIVFGDDVVGDTPIAPTSPTDEPTAPPAQAPEVEQPGAAYSAEEIASVDLSKVDFSQVDESKLPEAVKPFYPFIKAQTMRLRAYEAELVKAASQLHAQMQQANQPQAAQPQQRPPAIDIAAEAARRLGIKAEDFDPFNAQHRQAEMEVFRELEAIEKASQRPQPRQPQQPAAQPQISPIVQANFAALEAELVANMPDYEEFNAYAAQMITRIPPEMKAAIQQGTARGDMTLLRNAAIYMRQRFDEAKRTNETKNKAGSKVVDQPPALEGATGGVHGATKGIDLSQLAKLEGDPDAQARMLEALLTS